MAKSVTQEKEMIILKGIRASAGIAIGPCFVHSNFFQEVEPKTILEDEVESEIRRFRNAVAEIHAELKKAYEETVANYGENLATIVQIQLMTLEDKEFLSEVEEIISRQKLDAVYATFRIFRNKRDILLSQTNEYLRERAQDVQTLKKLIIDRLTGRSRGIFLEKPAIVVADDLSPNDCIELHSQQVLGFATITGGKNSHTAIVARSLSIPAVMGLENITEIAQTGDTLIVDGIHGEVIINPDATTIKVYKKRGRAFLALEKTLLADCRLKTETKDGEQIEIFANLEFEEELKLMSQVDADGVGLLRSEGIFLERDTLPSEAELTEHYKKVADQLYPRPVIIRTLDIGGDKIFPELATTGEKNPFLGWRAIRMCIDNPELFTVQLKAILKANYRGNVKIMLPMISNIEEVRQARQFLEGALLRLRAEGEKVSGDIDVGIMIEIPAAAVYADQFAREVDFFSIGTNDLVQYALAVDRGNERVAHLYSFFHPAVLRMIQMSLDAGKEQKIPVSMCGEMAADIYAIPLLLGMGFKSLSASPNAIPEMKLIVRELSLEECRQVYERVQNLKTFQEIRIYLEDFHRKKFGSLLAM